MSHKLFLVLVVVMIAFLPAVIFAEEINHPQVVKMTEGEWENWGGGSGGMDNVAAFSNHSPAYMNVAAGNSFYPIDLEVLVDIACATAGWDFYVTGDNLNQLFSGPFIPLWCNVTDSSGQWLTPSLYFSICGDNVAKVTAFELPLAYILRPGPANKLKLLTYASITITESYDLRFFMVPHEIGTRPRMIFLPSDTLWCSEVSLAGYQPPEEVIVNQINIIPQTLVPGQSNVALGAGCITTSFYGELRNTRLEIHWSDPNDSLYYLDWLHNIKIVFDNTQSTVAVELESFTLVAPENYAHFNFTDYFTFWPYQTRNFEILVSCDEQALSDEVWVVLGNTEEQWCFSSTSFKNLENNQWVTNIIPSYPISWSTFPISPVMLRVSLASNIGTNNATNGATDQGFVDFAFTALNADITVPFSRFYGFIQGSLNSDSLYVCRDFIDPPGAYVYIGNITNSLRIYDITVDPNMTTNLNSTVGNFSSANGAAQFSNMNWTIPNGQTHILRVVGNISNIAYQCVIEGSKWFKVDILDPNDIEAYDSFGNRVFITDNSGGPWEPGIDGNGNQLPYPVNNTSCIIQVTNCGELYVTAEANPSSTNVVAGASNVLMLNLRFQALNEAFEVTKLQILQANDPLYNRSVNSVSIRYENQLGQTVTAGQELITGAANFNLISNPIFISANSYQIVFVYFNLEDINQTLGAYTGDLVKAGFLGSPQGDVFEARGLSSGQILTQTSNSLDVFGNDMIVHGSVPTITVDQTNTNLANGLVDLYRFAITAPQEVTDLYIGQLPFVLALTDAVPIAAGLRLTMFQLYEGDSYATAYPLVGGMTSGTDAYNIYGPNGEGLYFSGSYLLANGGVGQLVTVTFYDDRLIPAGTTKYYILRAIAQNVNTGYIGDAIACWMHDGDWVYLPPFYADFSPETQNYAAVLDTDPWLSGDEIIAHLIWSDGTGTFGNFNHNQVPYSGGSASSLDWFNGYELENLSVIRILSGTYIEGDGQEAVILPTEFSVGNFPNPFNPETTISFSLPEATNVSLIVYDITGREVVRLADGYYSAGYHSVMFDGSCFSSGIYFYSLTTGKYSAVKKMMLVK